MTERGELRWSIRATVGQRQAALSLCAAVWGLALAIALLPVWVRPAPPGQIPGFLTLAGMDAHAPFRWVAGLIILPIALPLLLRWVIRHLARDDTRDWARLTAGVAMIEPLWFVLLTKAFGWVLLAPAVAVGIAFALRRFQAKFTRHDVLLVASVLPCYFAFLDLGFVDGAKTAVAAAGIVLAIRLAVVRIPSRGPEPLPAAYAFLLAPLALISQTEFFTHDQRHGAWLPLILVCVSPFLLRMIIPATKTARRRTALLLSVAIYPIVAYAYTSAFSLIAAEKKPRVTFFEDGHGLLPASEMLRGERPYRDILPGHGLISDGLLDFTAMRVHRQVSIGDALKAREVVGGLAGVGVYALATAATAVPEAGFLAYLLATMLGTGVPFVRVMPALLVLAIVVAATRRRAPKLFIWAGLGVVVCGLTSLDFCAYTAFAMIVAIVRFGKQRLAALRAAAIGLGAGLVPLFTALFALGIAGPFLTGTLFEVLGLGPVYAGFPWIAPQSLSRLRTFPEALALLFDRDVVFYFGWLASVLFVAIAFTGSPLRSRRRIEPLFITAVWMTITAISYAERHHVYSRFALPAILTAGVWLAFRARSVAIRALAPAGVVFLLVLGQPTGHMAVASMLRQTSAPLDPGWTSMTEPPRARGAWWRVEDVEKINAVRKYIELSLRPGETFFDFTNRGMFYFLFDRDCPIRQYEVAFYETPERQREVIDRLERNRRVTAVLLPATPDDPAAIVDGVPNEIRAPLVWTYIREHFEPDFAESGIVFWRRK